MSTYVQFRSVQIDSSSDNIGNQSVPKSAIDLGFEVEEERKRFVIQEREYLRQENAANISGQIDPVVGVEDTRPSQAVR
jgi:hypothetical protein